MRRILRGAGSEAATGQVTGQVGTAEIAARLRLAGAMLRFRGESLHKARAYEAGAEAIESVAGGDLKRLVDEERLTELPAIGKSLAATVTQLVREGRSESLERIMGDERLPAPLIRLSDVAGFTPRRIRLLHEALDVGSVEEVREALASGAAAEVRGIGGATAAKLLAALEREAEATGKQKQTLLHEAVRWGERLVEHLL